MDLKNKFYREIDRILSNLVSADNIKGIYIFTPDYVWEKITNKLEKHTKEKIRKIFYGEYTKESPEKLLKLFQKKYFLEIKTFKSKEERKILARPLIKNERVYKIKKKTPRK